MAVPNFDLNFDFSQSSTDSRGNDVPNEPVDERYGNENVELAIEAGKNENTKKKTKCDIQLLNTFVLTKRKCDVEEYTVNGEGIVSFDEIPPAKLDSLLADYFINTRQRDSSEYQPNTLRSQMASFSRWLLEKNYSFSLLEGAEFATTRQALTTKQKKLKGQGEGNLPTDVAHLQRKKLTRCSIHRFSTWRRRMVC